jgi:ribosome-associated protein
VDIRKKQRAVVDALEDIKGRDIVVFDCSKHSTIFERVIIASGDSNRHVHALADNVRDKMKAAGASVQGVEGGPDSDWVLVDLGDIVVHVMHPTVRSYYNLEELWGEKPVRLKSAAKPKAAPAKRRAPTKRKPPAKRRPATKRKASTRKRRGA